MAAPEVDLPVVCFLASETKETPASLLARRAAAAGWSEVAAALGVGPDRILLPLRRDPPPPFDAAYARWRGKGRPEAPLGEDDLLFWVDLRVLAASCETDPNEAAEQRRQGIPWVRIAAVACRPRP